MDNTVDNIFSVPPLVTHFRVMEYPNMYSTTEHVPTEHELLYVLDGNLALHLGEHLVFQGIPGDFLIVETGTRHRDEFAVLKGLRIMLLQFSWENKEFFKVIDNRSLLNLSYGVRNEVRRRLDFMRVNWDDSPEGLQHASIQLHGILLLFYFDLLKSQQNSGTHHPLPQQEAMRRAKHFLDQNFDKPLSLKETAGYIGISQAYLSRIFHHEYGVSFCKYLTALRLEAARQLLETHRLQIAEVATQCGFSSSSYFIKVFSKHYGITPGEYSCRIGENKK